MWNVPFYTLPPGAFTPNYIRYHLVRKTYLPPGDGAAAAVLPERPRIPEQTRIRKLEGVRPCLDSAKNHYPNMASQQ